jgi:hypothetical protein
MLGCRFGVPNLLGLPMIKIQQDESQMKRTWRLDKITRDRFELMRRSTHPDYKCPALRAPLRNAKARLRQRVASACAVRGASRQRRQTIANAEEGILSRVLKRDFHLQQKFILPLGEDHLDLE